MKYLIPSNFNIFTPSQITGKMRKFKFRDDKHKCVGLLPYSNGTSTQDGQKSTPTQTETEFTGFVSSGSRGFLRTSEIFVSSGSRGSLRTSEIRSARLLFAAGDTPCSPMIDSKIASFRALFSTAARSASPNAI